MVDKMIAILKVLVFLLARVSSTYAQAKNTTEATQSNSSAAVTPPSATNMSYTFIARPNGTAAASPGLITPPPRFNATVVEAIFQGFQEQYVAHHKLDGLDEEGQCLLRKRVEDRHLDYDAPEDGRYCGSYFDTIMCWPASPPGVINRPCPEELNDIQYDTSFNVTRYCNIDGTWGNANKSNYSFCSPKHTPESSGHDVAVQLLVYVGYSLSFTALVGAFCIFLFFRSLRCVRNYIHWNLIGSLILMYVAYFTTTNAAKAAKENPELLWLCRALLTVMMYIMMTNFFWMFVEGVYLYTLVVRALAVRRNRFWIYCIFGWGGPVPFVIAYVIVKKINSDDCWVTQDSYTYIIVSPIFIVIVINLYFLLHILAILFTKLRASHSLETQQYRKGVKGTMFLLPLLGVTYLLFVLGPVSIDDQTRTPSFYVYQYISTALSSLQGFFVAVIYVFLNQEVQNVIKRKIRRWREENTLPTRVVSRRGSNTRNSFGNLGLFGGRRSGNSGVGGDNENVTAFKLPGGNTSPEVYSNGSKVPPFIRLDEVQPLTPVSEAPTSPHTLYSSLSSGNGNNGDAQLMNGEEQNEGPDVSSSCNGLGESLDSDCNELPLLSVNACGTAQPVNGTPESSPHGALESGPYGGTSSIPEKELLHRSPDNSDILNGNHNNNNNLAPCLVRPKAVPSPLAGRSRVTFADELVHENHKRPVCCDAGKNAEVCDRSPTRKQDSERHLSLSQSDGDDSPDTGAGKQDTQRSPLIPSMRKKQWTASKPNGTIAFPKAPEGTPV